MFLTLLTCLNAIAYPQQTYESNIAQYQKRHVRWIRDFKPKIWICTTGKLKIEHVLPGYSFWNSQKENNKFNDTIFYAKNCDIKPPAGVILISDNQKIIDRKKEYGREITYFSNNRVTSSYIEVNSNLPENILQITIAHELGHALGYQHCLTCKKTDIMQIE